MKKTEYSLRKIDEGQKLLYEKLDYTPLEVPVGNSQPTTFNEAINKILYSSGIIDKDAYDKIRGISYDVDIQSDDDEDWDDFDDVYDDDFDVSEFASYDDYGEPEQTLTPDAPDEAGDGVSPYKPESSDVATSDSSVSNEETTKSK